MQQLRQQELVQPLLRQGNVCRPRALVLAPTRDLTTQIGEAAKTIAHEFRVRVRTVEGGTKTKTNTKALRETGADLLVATPARLKLLHQRRVVSLREVRHVIVDEADDMLLRGFDADMAYVLGKCPPRGNAADADDDGRDPSEPRWPQLAFVSATLGADVKHVLRQNWPDVEPLVSMCAHKAPASLTHELVTLSGDKLDELRRLLTSAKWTAATGTAAISSISGRELPRTLIFCRGIQSARAVQHALAEAGLPVGGCHGSMPEYRRRADLDAFTCSPPLRPLLVCTDVTARGIDFPHVTRVVNFDFPATSALYLHRAGRTARFGRQGTVVSLVHDSQRRFAESIRDAIERKAELHVVRKGDLRERTRAPSARGKAGARATVGKAKTRLTRQQKSDRKQRGKRAARGPTPKRPPIGVPAWRVNKHYN